MPAHFAGMDQQLEDMQGAVIRAGLPEQDKRRREEMRFWHCLFWGTLVPGGLNQDFSFTWFARTLACFYASNFKFSAITNSHIFPDEGSIAETSEFYLQFSAFNLPPYIFQ